jgi:hypothetical protein
MLADHRAGSFRRLGDAPLRSIWRWCERCSRRRVRCGRAFAGRDRQREIDSGVTLRSDQETDFTTFGELGQIVRKNWDSFGGTFSSQKAFTRIMASLNTLRGPIAHCCPLAADEVVRLRLTVRDWFRLME